MLKISQLADYANAIMNVLAAEPEEILSAAEIAERLHFSLPTVSKILKLLSDAELLYSQRGSRGGYQLARPASKIPLIAIIAAVDGAPALTKCSQHGLMCQQDKTCLIKHNWQLLNHVIVHVFQTLTLADMSQSLMSHPFVANLLDYQKS